jgi:peptide/nickel transport system ATP-binding protein
VSVLPASLPTDVAAPPLLDIRGLRTHYPIRAGLLQRVVGSVRALDGVDLAIRAGETFALVGESGSGKTTLGKAILGLAPVTAGEIRLAERPIPPRLGDRQIAERRAIQMVFQDVATSLNPRRTVGATIADPLHVNKIGSPKDRHERVLRLLDMVELPRQHAQRYPHELSGGERQRVGVARALAMEPRLIVLDEPTSALDVSVQAKVVDLLIQLQRELGLTYLLITHDLALVKHLATRVAVMYLGHVMEAASAEAIFAEPHNPYTTCLLNAIPGIEDEVAIPGGRRLRVLPGDVPSPRDPPPGCVFHTRCPMNQPICASQAPTLREVRPGQVSWCHFDVNDLASAGSGAGPAE